MAKTRSSLPCILCLLFLVQTYHAWTTTSVSLRTALSVRQQERSSPSSTALHISGVPTRYTLQTEPQDGDGNDDVNSALGLNSLHYSVKTASNTTSEQSHLTSSSSQQKEGNGIAIILNTNARGVSSGLVDAIKTQFYSVPTHKARIFVTSTEEQARQAVQELLRQPAKVVIPIGGDGTLTTMIQLFYDISPESLPLFGYIPMGTGNALGTVIGCKPRRRFRQSKRMQAMQDVLQQLLDISESLEKGERNIQSDIVDLPLLQITTSVESNDDDDDQPLQQQEKVCCFFAGVGFDSLMLQDYKDLQEWSKQSPFWRNKFRSVWGYTVALFTRTLPKCITDQSHICTVELSTTQPALWVDHRRGDVVRSIMPKDESSKTLLYRGDAGIVAAATTPFYGGNLKLFPFARVTEKGCQVRVGRIHPLQGVLNIPQIFRGTYRNSNMGCLDFIGTQFSLELLENNINDDDGDDADPGYPVQHSGESMGHSQHVEIQVLEDPVQFVTLLPPRMVCEDGSCY
eukprot:scaffold23675_cov108-Cylindrotheca_fusiformis.AAC.2